MLSAIARYRGPARPGSDGAASVQEKVLLWLLQFMQEQAISLDEVEQNGNTAVHVAAQHGHLTCIQVRGPVERVWVCSAAWVFLAP